MRAKSLSVCAIAAGALVASACPSPEPEEPAEPVEDPVFEEPDEDEPDEHEEPYEDDPTAEPEALAATAVLEARSGSDVEGEIDLVQTDEGVHLDGEISGLEPGPRGFHVHEHGDCSAEDSTSAGGHFNPKDAPHGAPGDDEHHVGDLGNIEADDDGVAQVDLVYDFLTLEEGEQNSIAGRALVVHGGQDDFESQPAGDAGPRVGCGVIELE